tara:strand:- start:5700 stop:6197 length:498 start_codon:yes stop_codon:yes gene_type:complete
VEIFKSQKHVTNTAGEEAGRSSQLLTPHQAYSQLTSSPRELFKQEHEENEVDDVWELGALKKQISLALLAEDLLSRLTKEIDQLQSNDGYSFALLHPDSRSLGQPFCDKDRLYEWAVDVHNMHVQAWQPTDITDSLTLLSDPVFKRAIEDPGFMDFIKQITTATE